MPTKKQLQARLGEAEKKLTELCSINNTPDFSGYIEAREAAFKADLDAERAHAIKHAGEVEELLNFLENLLVLEPSLERFRTEDDGWDFAVAEVAANHVLGQAFANAYAAPSTRGYTIFEGAGE